MPNHPSPDHPDDAEFHVWEAAPDERGQDAWLARWLPWLEGRRVLDVGCGEGHLLAAMVRRGMAAEGVDLTPSLAARAREQGLPVTCADAAAFIAQHGARFDAYAMMDFVEHVPFVVTRDILSAVPAGGRVIIQTPNTNSLVGHQFYLQVPSHVTPLSPAVLGRTLQKLGYRTLAEGTLYGGLPWTGLRRRVTEFLLVKLLGTVTTRMLAEGANYYVVAERSAVSPGR